MTMRTERKSTIDSNGSKRSESGCLMIHAKIVMKGTTKRAIWILEPTATPIYKVNRRKRSASCSRGRDAPQKLLLTRVEHWESRDTHRKVDLVVHRDSDGRNVLGDVSGDGKLCEAFRELVTAQRTLWRLDSQVRASERTRIKPTHSTLISGCCCVKPLMLSTRNSDVTAEMHVSLARSEGSGGL